MIVDDIRGWAVCKMVKLPNKKCSDTIIPIRKLDHGFCSQYKNQVTIFPQIVSAETILF
jgi:hypothetical protein